MKPSFPTFYLSRFTNKVNCAAMAVPPHVRPIKRKRKRERERKVSYTRVYLSIIPHKSLKLVWSLEVRLFCLVELTSEVALKTSNYCIGGHQQQTYNGSGFNVGWIRDMLVYDNSLSCKKNKPVFKVQGPRFLLYDSNLREVFHAKNLHISAERRESRIHFIS
jgi:hypothetical protein